MVKILEDRFENVVPLYNADAKIQRELNKLQAWVTENKSNFNLILI